MSGLQYRLTAADDANKRASITFGKSGALFIEVEFETRGGGITKAAFNNLHPEVVKELASFLIASAVSAEEGKESDNA
ncbi:hypothetical protein V6767_20405 [Martelella sp. FLE1502]